MVMSSGVVGEPGRVPEGRQGAYVATGVMFLLFGLIELAWTVRGATQLKGSPGAKDYLMSLVDPASRYAQAFLGEPASVVLALALLVVGLVAMAKRRAARGAAVVLAFVMLFLTGRGLVGLHSSVYRQAYLHNGTEYLLRFSTFGLGFLFSLIVVFVMLRASENAEQQSTGMGYGQQSGW